MVRVLIQGVVEQKFRRSRRAVPPWTSGFSSIFGQRVAIEAGGDVGTGNKQKKKPAPRKRSYGWCRGSLQSKCCRGEHVSNHWSALLARPILPFRLTARGGGGGGGGRDADPLPALDFDQAAGCDVSRVETCHRFNGQFRRHRGDNMLILRESGGAEPSARAVRGNAISA